MVVAVMLREMVGTEDAEGGCDDVGVGGDRVECDGGDGLAEEMGPLSLDLFAGIFSSKPQQGN